MATGNFFAGQFFGGGFYGSVIPPEPPVKQLDGGAGGSNNAGKKHSWERRGHVISAIQSGAYLAVYDLPEETAQDVKQTRVVEAYVVKNDLQIASLEVLLHTITEALKTLEDSEQSREAKRLARESAHQYKLKVREDYQRKQVRRRRDEEAFLQILLHL